MANLNFWNNVDADNDAPVPDGWPENVMTLPDVNDAGRQVQGSVARDYNDTNGTLAATGAADAYVLTTNNAHASLFAGLRFMCTIPVANTGASTINVDGLGATAIQRAGAATAAGDMLAGGTYQFVYNGSAFQLLNPSASSSGGTVTSVGSGVGLTGGPINTSGELALDTANTRNVDHAAVSLAGGAGVATTIGDLTANRTIALDLTKYADSFGAGDIGPTTEMLVQVEGTPRRMAYQNAGARIITNVGIARTMALGDANSIVRFVNGSASTYTVNNTLGDGAAVVIRAVSAAVTISPSGVTLDSTIAQNSSATRTVNVGGTAVIFRDVANRLSVTGDIS